MTTTTTIEIVQTYTIRNAQELELRLGVGAIPAFNPETWRRELPRAADPAYTARRQSDWDVEDRIVARLVFDILAEAPTWRISVDDGEEIVTHRSRDPHAILGSLYSTDEDRLIVHDGQRHIGWVLLIGGNGCDIISDWAPGRDDSALSLLIEAGAMKIAAEYQ